MSLPGAKSDEAIPGGCHVSLRFACNDN